MPKDDRDAFSWPVEPAGQDADLGPIPFPKNRGNA